LKIFPPPSFVFLVFGRGRKKIWREEGGGGGEVNKKKFCGVKKIQKTATQFGGGGD